MIGRILKFFQSKKTDSNNSSALVDDNSIREIVSNRYPPYDEGFTVFSGEKLLEQHEPIIRRIKYIAGVNHAEFDRLYMPILVKYAEFVQLLPASQNHHHKGAGGLLRHGLEVGKMALELTSGIMFSGKESTELKRVLEPRWRFATFVAGLLHDVGKPVSDIEVIDKNGRIIWNPFERTISMWAKDNDLQRYYIRWRHERKHKNHEMFSGLISNALIPEYCNAYISEGGPQVTGAMMASVSGLAKTDERDSLHQLVLKADSWSVKNDLVNNNSDSVKGTPVEMYIVDTIRGFINSSDKKWKLNASGGRLWYSEEGLFIIWGGAADDVKAQLRKSGIPGIPHNSDTLAEILSDHGYIEKYIYDSGEESLYWKIKMSFGDKSHVFKMLKFARTGIFYEDLSSYEPVDMELVLKNPVNAESSSSTTTDAPTKDNQEGGSEQVQQELLNDDTAESDTKEEDFDRNEDINEFVDSESEDSEGLSGNQEKSRKWLLSKGKCGPAIEALISEVIDEDLQWGEKIFEQGNKIAFLSDKKMFQELGFSLQIIKEELNVSGFADKNPKKIDSIDHEINIGGVKKKGVVVLGTLFSKHCFAYLGDSVNKTDSADSSSSVQSKKNDSFDRKNLYINKFLEHAIEDGCLNKNNIFVSNGKDVLLFIKTTKNEKVFKISNYINNHLTEFLNKNNYSKTEVRNMFSKSFGDGNVCLNDTLGEEGTCFAYCGESDLRIVKNIIKGWSD